MCRGRPRKSFETTEHGRAASIAGGQRGKLKSKLNTSVKNGSLSKMFSATVQPSGVLPMASWSDPKKQVVSDDVSTACSNEIYSLHMAFSERCCIAVEDVDAVGGLRLPDDQAGAVQLKADCVVQHKPTVRCGEFGPSEAIWLERVTYNLDAVRAIAIDNVVYDFNVSPSDIEPVFQVAVLVVRT